jgi:hypothetical protein
MRREDLGNGPSSEHFQLWVSPLHTVLPDVLGQQPRSPRLLRIAQLFGFLAGQVDNPGPIFRYDRPLPTASGQIAHGGTDTQLQGLEMQRSTGSIGIENRSYGGLSGVKYSFRSTTIRFPDVV